MMDVPNLSAAPDPAAPDSTVRRLLIVDDDVDFAVSTSRALGLAGVDCTLVHSGAGALDQLARDPVEVVLLDIRLGGEDGTDLAARLRARHPDLIVIIMTAYASVDSAVAALKAGAYDYLRKPFFLDELVQAFDAQAALLSPAAQNELRELFGLLQNRWSRRWLVGLAQPWAKATPAMIERFLASWRDSR